MSASAAALCGGRPVADRALSAARTAVSAKSTSTASVTVESAQTRRKGAVRVAQLAPVEHKAEAHTFKKERESERKDVSAFPRESEPLGKNVSPERDVKKGSTELLI